ncbi:hypothetical protein FM107_05040 [Sphingobacterium sp. JB170]|nr:hypothetical protein FM107_05040 [Sphingobacterium sp. JB170]
MLGNELGQIRNKSDAKTIDKSRFLWTPDETALGDEKWMAFFKQIGIVKNLHFKVGHAAILLIERNSGKILYYDF